jgi:fructose-1,6-bisphosphatase
MKVKLELLESKQQHQNNFNVFHREADLVWCGLVGCCRVCLMCVLAKCKKYVRENFVEMRQGQDFKLSYYCVCTLVNQ